MWHKNNKDFLHKEDKKTLPPRNKILIDTENV